MPTSPVTSPTPTSKWLLPGAVAFAVLCGTVGYSVAKSGRTDAKPEVTITTSPSPSPVADDLSPAAVLAEIPVAGAETPAGKEVLRWRERAEKRPEIPQLWVNLGDALMQLAREKVDPHNVGPAEKAYKLALSLKANDPGAMIGLAWIAGSRHQFLLSIEWAEKGVALMPQDHRAYGLIGDAYVEMGDYDAAFESYQKMLDIRPDITSYSRGAHILYLTGDTRKALWLMGKAINAGSATGEESAWCRAQLGEMLFETGALLPAESTLKTARKLAPNNYHLLTVMGKVQRAKGNTKEAIALLEKAVAISPQHGALVALYETYVAAGRTADAEKTFDAIVLAAEHHKTHGNADSFYLARFYADAGKKLPLALEIVQSKTDLPNPVDADTAAWVYYQNGKYPEAKKWIDISLKKMAPDATRLYHAGMIYSKVGSPFLARRYLDQAMNKNAYFSPVHAKIAAATYEELSKIAPGTVAAKKSVSGDAKNTRGVVQ